jgi:hypothetical protein
MVILQNEPIGTGSPLKSFVLKLGGFHTQMRFIGSIGYLMSGSGLANLLETVYATTAVSHMMSGKALARAVRCHFLVDTALTALILSLVYGIPVPKFKSNSAPWPSSTETDQNAVVLDGFLTHEMQGCVNTGLVAGIKINHRKKCYFRFSWIRSIKFVHYS